MNVPLRTDNLRKVYKLGNNRTKVAVNSLDIEVPEGSIFGFLGPNGAGKTTTIKMILDFVRPTCGRATIFGKPTDDASTRKLIGYLPEQPYFHRFLKPIEVVSMHAALAGVDRHEIKKQAMLAIERTGIAEYANTPISKLSKGLTQRVGIAQAIVGDPQLLILDEPTSGLDPIGRHHTRDLFQELKGEGKTIFLSSHLLGEVENLCDIVGVMKSGELVACGAPEEVKGSDSMITVETAHIDSETAHRLKFLDVVIEQHNNTAILKIDPQNIYEIMRAMEELRLPIHKIETKHESLEEAFLRLAA